MKLILKNPSLKIMNNRYYPLLACLFSLSFPQISLAQSHIDQLIDNMTIEQKVGQMTQLNLGFLSTKSDQENVKIKQIDPEKLTKAIHDYHVGSILNNAGTAYTVDEWHGILTLIQDIALDSELQIPVLYGIDAIHGATYTKGSTLFPHNMGLAASRNRQTAYDIAAVTAKETRASGLRWNFDPVIDVGRNPLWPRFGETFGEDPHLVSEMGVNMIKGYENDGLGRHTAVGSCMKHFVGYSVPKSGKDRTESYISDISLWQKHIPSFKAAIEAGASTIMINSSMINDVPVHSSYEILTELLRNKLGFEGLIITDWEDIIRLHVRHKIAETPIEAVKIAINAGIDMSMVPSSFSFCKHLVDLVKSGEISEARLDESVRRILTFKMDLGLFDNPYPEMEAVSNFGDPQYRVLALEAARESMTLLKNKNNTLPLPQDKHYLVLGPGANCVSALNGSWSYSWQGDKEELYPDDYKTVMDVLKSRISNKQIISNVTNGYDDENNFTLTFSEAELKKVDYVLLFLGENAYAESPGNIDDLTLDDNQIQLAKRAADLGKPVVLILTEGRPRIINDFSNEMDAILMSYIPGSMGAQAIVDVLFGDYNPSGVLPFTYPSHTGDLVTYDHKFLTAMVQTAPNKTKYGGHHPEFEFGHGLSYTTFSLSSIQLNTDTIDMKGVLDVSITVTNTGNVHGQKCIDVFLQDHYASYAPDMKNLKYFTKVALAPGEKKQITFTLDSSSLFYYNEKGEKIFEKGDYTLMMGDQSRDFHFAN